MKIKILALLFSFLICTRAEALVPVNMGWTGFKAERMDYGGYAAGPGSSTGYIGGPVANNSLGGAWQFRLAEPTRFAYVLFDADVENQHYDRYESIEFDFKLYTSTLQNDYGYYPDVDSLALTSPLFVETRLNEYGFYDINKYRDNHVPFDIELQPGEYWYAQERDFRESGPIVRRLSSDFYAYQMASSHLPEPTTLALLGSGLGLAALCRRMNKNTKGVDDVKGSIGNDRV